MTAALSPVCQVCGSPADASYFDVSSIALAPQQVGEEVVLARYELPRHYCGVLLYFAQFTDLFASDPTLVSTPGYQWQIRCDGQPLAPYLTFDRIINPWGLSGFPINLRLDDGVLVELALRKSAPTGGESELPIIGQAGGRLLGRYWYNPVYGEVAR